MNVAEAWDIVLTMANEAGIQAKSADQWIEARDTITALVEAAARKRK